MPIGPVPCERLSAAAASASPSFGLAQLGEQHRRVGEQRDVVRVGGEPGQRRGEPRAGLRPADGAHRGGLGAGGLAQALGAQHLAQLRARLLSSRGAARPRPIAFAPRNPPAARAGRGRLAHERLERRERRPGRGSSGDGPRSDSDRTVSAAAARRGQPRDIATTTAATPARAPLRFISEAPDATVHGSASGVAGILSCVETRGSPSTRRASGAPGCRSSLRARPPAPRSGRARCRSWASCSSSRCSARSTCSGRGGRTSLALLGGMAILLGGLALSNRAARPAAAGAPAGRRGRRARGVRAAARRAAGDLRGPDAQRVGHRRRRTSSCSRSSTARSATGCCRSSPGPRGGWAASSRRASCCSRGRSRCCCCSRSCCS